MITQNKKFMLAFKVFSLLCIIAAVVCLICNFALNKGVTWSGYPLISIAFAWVVISTLLLAKNHRILSTLTIITVMTMPFLYLLERLTPIKGWFSALGVPLAVTGIVAIWITYFLMNYVKMNKWYLSASFVFLYGVVVASISNYYANVFIGNKFLNLSNVISIFSCAVVAVLLGFIGHYKNLNKKLQEQS